MGFNIKCCLILPPPRRLCFHLCYLSIHYFWWQQYILQILMKSAMNDHYQVSPLGSILGAISTLGMSDQNSLLGLLEICVVQSTLLICLFLAIRCRLWCSYNAMGSVLMEKIIAWHQLLWRLYRVNNYNVVIKMSQVNIELFQTIVHEGRSHPCREEGGKWFNNTWF